MLIALMLLALIWLTWLPVGAYRRRHTDGMVPVRVFTILAAAPLLVVIWSAILFIVRPRLGSTQVLELAPSILVLGAVGAITTIAVPIWYRHEPAHNRHVLAGIWSLAVLGSATFVCWFTFAFF